MSIETPEQVETAPVAEEKPARKVKESGPCACSRYSAEIDSEIKTTGCGGYTTPRTFGPGHDAKLKSLLIKAAVAGVDVTKTTDEGTESLSPVHAAEEFGFRSQVEKGLELHQAKIEARKARAAERERLRQERAAKREAEKEERKRVQEERKAAADEEKSRVAKLNEEKAPGRYLARVGRRDIEGEVLQDGTFRYADDQGNDVETEHYTLISAL